MCRGRGEGEKPQIPQFSKSSGKNQTEENKISSTPMLLNHMKTNTIINERPSLTRPITFSLPGTLRISISFVSWYCRRAEISTLNFLSSTGVVELMASIAFSLSVYAMMGRAFVGVVVLLLVVPVPPLLFFLLLSRCCFSFCSTPVVDCERS